ncbi:MAG: hypothetical protein WKF40_05030 [Thermoleophilaceae bacterium]
MRALVSPAELQGAARALRRQIPQLAGLNRDLLPFLRQARLLSSCTNEVLVPWANTPIPNPDEPAQRRADLRPAGQPRVRGPRR